MKIILLIVILIISSAGLNADDDAQELLERIFEELSPETEYSPVFDEIDFLMQNPVNLRTARMGDLEGLPGFSPTLMQNIIFAAQSDSLPDLFRIAESLNLSDEQMFILQSCTYTDSIANMPQKSRLIFRTRYKKYFNKVKGFEDNKFRGSNVDWYNRMTYKSEKVSAGLLFDKDAGELNLNDNYSGYANLHLKDFSIILGDYTVEAGMGNILWKSFGLRKGTNVIAPAMQYSADISPWQTALDYGFFRGAAAKYETTLSENSSIKAMIWVSSAKRSATIDTAADEATSIYLSGYYRTDTEIAKKDKLGERCYGGLAEYGFHGLRLGASAIALDYDLPIKSSSSSAFSGKHGVLATSYLTYSNESISSGMELSFDANGNPAFKAGLQSNGINFDGALHVRSYSQGFRSPYGYNFGEFSYPANEYGVYTALLWKPSRVFNISGYLDIFGTYSNTYYVPAKTRGTEFFLETLWKTDYRINLLFRIKHENKTDAAKLNKDDFYTIFQRDKYSARFETLYSFSSKLSLRLRVEGSYVRFAGYLPDENGAAMFAEFKYILVNFLQIGARAALFSTDSYTSAVWQYESTLPGYMSSTALYGDGARGYVWLKISPIAEIDIWARYAITSKNNVKTLGSGLSEIEGSEDKRLILQMDVRFN